MRRTLWILSILALAPSQAVPATGPAQKPFAIEHVRVFDGDRVIPSATVVIEDGRITAAGADVAVPEGATRVDGRGRTLLPGLIDAHVHTAGDREALTQAAAFGVTTVLEMLSSPARAAALRREIAASPSCAEADYLTSGAGATVEGGHGHFSADYPTLSGPGDAEAFVRGRVEAGASYIKIFVERGSPRRPLPALDGATVRAVIDAAHRHGKLAIVHATQAADVRMAIEAGADGLAHLWQGGLDASLLDLVVSRRVFVIPTLSMIEAMIELGRLPPDRQVFLDVVRRLHEAGVPVLAGTDAANPGLSHGASLHRELELLVEAGLDAPDALRAATSATASHFRLEGRGRIAPGVRADLILVDGNPSEEIRATREIVAVWKCGKRL